MGTTFHFGIVEPLLLTLLRNEGAGGVLAGWKGTDAEAIAAVEMDPREVFVLSPECDNQDDTGECKGHPDPESR